MPNGDRTLNVVGDSFCNANGGQRQVEISFCHAGEAVGLRRARGSHRGMKAVAVISCRGVQVGNLKAEDARWVDERMEYGTPMPAIIERINGGTPDRPSLGLTIRLNIDGITPIARRRGWFDKLLDR